MAPISKFIGDNHFFLHHIMVWLAVVIVLILLCLGAVAMIALGKINMPQKINAREVGPNVSNTPLFIDSITLFVRPPYMLSGTRLEVYAGAQKLPTQRILGKNEDGLIAAQTITFAPSAVTDIRASNLPRTIAYVRGTLAGREVVWLRVRGEQIFTVV